jgi:hypothetical protein
VEHVPESLYATKGKDDKDGKKDNWPKAYKSKIASLRHREKLSTFCARWYKDESCLVLQDMREWLRKETEKKDWAGKNMLEWPEFQQDEMSDDEALEDEEIEEVDLTGERDRERPVKVGRGGGSVRVKEKEVADFQVESDREESEEEEPRKRQRRPAPAPKDFTNKSAAGRGRVKERYEELQQHHLNAGGHNKVPKMDYPKLWEQAQQEIADEDIEAKGGGRRARRKGSAQMTDSIEPTDIESLTAKAFAESAAAAHEARQGGGGGSYR